MPQSWLRSSASKGLYFQALREALQSATISALMASRRWQPGDLAFQGGTCLQLVHGSARFSEDLNFMVLGGLSLGGPNVIGSAKVKIELWQTESDALTDIKLLVKQIRSPSGIELSQQALLTRLDIYPSPTGQRIDTACRWMESAHRNLQNLTSTHAPKAVAMDLRRWLPSSIPMDAAIADDMIQLALGQLRNGQGIIGSDMTMLFGWSSQTASTYLANWRRAGLVQSLGGRSDVHMNLVRNPIANSEGALRRAFPMTTKMGADVIREAGWTTQIIRAPEVAVPNGPLYAVTGFTLSTQADQWFRRVAPGTQDNPMGLRFLAPAWGLADMIARAKDKRIVGA